MYLPAARIVAKLVQLFAVRAVDICRRYNDRLDQRCRECSEPSYRLHISTTRVATFQRELPPGSIPETPPACSCHTVDVTDTGGIFFAELPPRSHRRVSQTTTRQGQGQEKRQEVEQVYVWTISSTRGRTHTRICVRTHTMTEDGKYMDGNHRWKETVKDRSNRRFDQGRRGQSRGTQTGITALTIKTNVETARAPLMFHTPHPYPAPTQPLPYTG